MSYSKSKEKLKIGNSLSVIQLKHYLFPDTCTPASDKTGSTVMPMLKRFVNKDSGRYVV